MELDVLEEVKILLDITSDDLDTKLGLIIKHAINRLKTLLNDEEVPESLRHIITEISVKRYNRIGSEGMKSMSVEGESLSFEEDDFAEYQNEIDAYLSKKSGKGIVRFI